jgi:CheY-like chemotaxis protein
MPVMGGYAAASEIHKRAPDLPILFILHARRRAPDS